jgi:CRISPR/Cas system-associated exonuclease Cas4 (RecB family)
MVETEVKLQYGGLEGRIDFLRKTAEGYVIHEEKYQEPPREDIFPDHRLQLNAYAYLAENCGYAPVKSAYIIYNDLRPREIKPEPETILGLVEEVRSFIETVDALPARDEGVRCEMCSYYPLCQVLPLGGGIKEDHLKILRQTEMNVKLIKELEESLKIKKFKSA